MITTRWFITENNTIKFLETEIEIPIYFELQDCQMLTIEQWLVRNVYDAFNDEGEEADPVISINYDNGDTLEKCICNVLKTDKNYLMCLGGLGCG